MIHDHFTNKGIHTRRTLTFTGDKGIVNVFTPPHFTKVFFFFLNRYFYDSYKVFITENIVFVFITALNNI